ATKPQTVQIVRQGEATPYWFKFNPLYQTFQSGKMFNGHRIRLWDIGLHGKGLNMIRLCLRF
ncbi:hypothetical protein, partial [Neisseria meningitidis]